MRRRLRALLWVRMGIGEGWWANGLEVGRLVTDQGWGFPCMTPWKAPRRPCTGHGIHACRAQGVSWPSATTDRAQAQWYSLILLEMEKTRLRLVNGLAQREEDVGCAAIKYSALLILDSEAVLHFFFFKLFNHELGHTEGTNPTFSKYFWTPSICNSRKADLKCILWPARDENGLFPFHPHMSRLNHCSNFWAGASPTVLHVPISCSRPCWAKRSEKHKQLHSLPFSGAPMVLSSLIFVS